MEGTGRIRVFGDPVLRSVCPDVGEIDSTLVKLATDMIETMRAYRGVGVAATQVGVKKRMFVYDDGGGARTIVNPHIVETEGKWDYEEGCLSVPGLFFPIQRPDRVVLTGLDLDGNELHLEATELTGRIFQHEVDHLDGKLLLSRLDSDQRKKAMAELRSRTTNDA